MKFDGPDAALRWWYAARRRLERPPAFDPVAMRGLKYQRTCPRCGTRRHRVQVRRRTGEIFARCVRCGAEREGVEVFVLRGRVSLPAAPTGLKIAELADVTLAIEAARRGIENEFRAYAMHVSKDQSTRETLEQLAADGIRFTAWGLRRAARAARSSFALQLYERGLLEDPTRWVGAPRWGSRIVRKSDHADVPGRRSAD